MSKKFKDVATHRFRFYATRNQFTVAGEFRAIAVSVRRSTLKQEIVKRGIGYGYSFTPGTSDAHNHKGYRVGCFILAKLNRFGDLVA